MTASSDALVPNNGQVLSSPKQQSLGGNTYCIDPNEIIPRSDRHPKWKKALISTGMVFASPVLIPAAIVYAISMYIGPMWWKNKAMQALLTRIMGQVAEMMDPHRKELLQHIMPSDKVMDLGAGPGYYMKYLRQAGRIVALEPNSKFHKDYIQRAVDEGLSESQIEVYDLVVESYVAQHSNQLGTFDYVILGNVLCEVEDQLSTLECVNKLLKPGGHVYFSEHIAAPPGTWARTLQNWMNPFWQVVAGGCNCNRDSLANIRQKSGWQVTFWQYDHIKVALGPIVLGLALKK